MRKRILSILLCLVMVVGLFPTMAFAAGGSGTASNPIVVTTFEELKAALEKDTVGLGMQYIKVPNGINIEKLLKLESYNSAFNVIRQKTLIVDGTVTVIAAAGTAAVRSMFSVHGPGNRLDIRGSGSLTFKANTNASCNAVVDVNDEGMLNVSGGVTLSGTFNTAVYGMAVYNYGGTVNIDNATLTGETAGVSYGAAVHANGGTTNIKNATLKSSVSPGANAISRKGSGTIFVGKDASLTIENSIIHTTDGVTDGHSIYLERGNTKHISNYLGTNQKIYRQSDKVQLSADVTSLTDSVYITDDVSEKINAVSLTVGPLITREMISDLACSYSPSIKMTLTNFNVYKGLNNTSDKIEGENTPYDPNQSYTVMYVFRANEGFKFSTEATKNVTVTGGNFWMADTYGGTTNAIRVFVTFPGATPIESVTLNVPELKVGDTSGDFTLSGTNTGVSAVTTEWRDIPSTGAEESTFYRALVTLKAEDGYAFDANTNVTLIGDYWGSSTGITSDGKTMTVLVSVRILHKHTFGEWKDLGNKEYHFRSCSCLSQEKEPHNWEYVAGDKYKCTVCKHTIDGEMTRITYMYASLRSPIDGESPSSHTTEEWVGISGNHYTVESLVWKNEDGSDVTTFEAGKIYKGTVTFKAETGFVFAKDKINADDIFSSDVENVGDYTLNPEATILTADFKLKDNTVVRPGLNVKVKLPTLNDKIGQSFPAAELVDTTLPVDVELTTSVYENIFASPITGSVEPNKTYFYAVKLQFKNSSDDITKAYNVSYTVTDGGDAEYHTDNLAGYGILARYQTPDTSKISSVALTVTAPKYGEAPATTATGANDTLYTVGTPEWSPAVTDGKFGAAAYTVSTPVTAKSGYSFDANCLYTVNGYVATYADGKVSYTFPALTAPHEHNFGGAWTWWNDSEHYQSCACGEMQFKAHTFGNWTSDPTNADKHFKECSVCHHKVRANHVESNKITDTAAGIGTAGTWYTKCDVCDKKMNTGTIPALVKIDVAKLTVAKPVKDAAAEMATTGDSTYYVANTEWTAADGATLAIGETFKPGTAYTVKITLEAKNSNVFTADSTYNKIEGKDAKLVTAVTGYTYSVILTYTFDATEGTYVPTKPAITTVTLPDGKVGDAYNQTLAATGTNPIAWSIETGNLPDGLTLVGDTIKGTPSKAGDFKFTVKATNGGGSDTKELTIKIADAEAAKYHNVTLTGAGTGATGAGSHAAGTTVNIYAGTKSGYTFNGWTSDDVTVLSASSKNASFVMPNDDVIVKANWVYNGGGSSGGGVTTYPITVKSAKNGDVTASHKTASKGTTVTLTVDPDKGYVLDTLTVLDGKDKEIKLTEKNGKYTFTMPASKVTVEAMFKAAGNNPFIDVPAGSYYEDAVIWAVGKGITTGTSATTFNPNGICTRAQAVTFLWRAAGSPAPKTKVMPFADVKAGSYYYDAVLWAVENGITKGTSETMFSPDATCSRAQIVTFLWRSQKSPAAGTANPFTDVKASAYYADAVLWAVKEDVTKGTTNTTFSPDANCTRAQIVTFIWRTLAE